jgi:branched-chain amino acid transport system permease protein
MLSNFQLLADVPVLNVQLLLDGMMIGAIFALAAYGLALVWGVMNVKNLAQGEFVIMGGYVAFFMYRDLGINPLWALPVAGVLMFGFGWIAYELVIRWVIGRDLFTSLLATFGMAIIIQQLLNLIFGPDVQTAHSGLGTRLILGSVTVQEIRALSLLIAIPKVASSEVNRSRPITQRMTSS